MNLREAREVLEMRETHPDASRVYGQPYETADGTTVIPVVGKPLGLFVIKDGQASWVPAVDATRLALIGALTGFVAAAFATLAMVRRPPWPDLKGDISPRS